MSVLLAALALLADPPVHAKEEPIGAQNAPIEAQDAPQVRPGDLRIGHWVQVKGEYTGDGNLVADEIELLQPAGEYELVGTVERVVVQRGRFWVVGHLVHTDEETEWKGLELADLQGQRVKVKGDYRGPRKFSAKEVASRGPGRDSIEGRIDDARTMPDGLELLVGNARVLIDAETEIVSESRVQEYRLAELDHEALSLDRREFQNEDERIPATIPIGPDLYFGALLETRVADEDDFDLNSGREGDRTDFSFEATGELRWAPHRNFSALFRGRLAYLDRSEADDPDTTVTDAELSELWGYWARLFGSDFDLQVGRQDFDEPREWIYDQNLDAVRLVWKRWGVRAELSASTVLADGSPRDENSGNLIAYVSNGNYERHLAVYVIDRRDDREPKDYPIHFGARALGEWIDANRLWAEFSVLRGYSDDVDLKSYGFDLGTTWSPGFLEPLNVTAGYAFGSGDDSGTEDANESFRQTGLEDNSGKFGGVTSFRYYGELLDPELSNLGILTAGLGWRIDRRTSLDLVFHDYRQVEAADRLRNAELDRHPDGVHEALGSEVDLVLGLRGEGGMDVKFVLGHFDPGAAFPDGDAAWLASMRLRYRF